jgi:hypothetical protein
MKKKNLLFTVFTSLLVTSAGIAQNLPSYVPTNGLVGWWSFDGNANDVSGNGNTGIVNGAVLTTDRFGNFDNAYNFNGTSDFINVGTLTFNSFTITGWFQIFETAPDGGWPGCATGYTIVSNMHQSNSDPSYLEEGVEILHNENYRLQYLLGNGTSWQTDNIYFDYQTTIGTWKFFALTYDSFSNSATLYDEDITNQVSSFDFSNNNLETYIGARPGCYNSWNTGRFLKGNIDDIGIWNRALSVQELGTLFNATNTSSIPLLEENKFVILQNKDSETIKINSSVSCVGQDYFLYDCSGRVYSSGKITSPSMVLSTNNLSPGVYIFSLGKGQNQKVIISN